MDTLIAMLIFPGGLFILGLSLFYSWLNRKWVARLQNRIGARWFQPFADLMKLLINEEIVPSGVHPLLFAILPMFALAATLTVSLYLPIGGIDAPASFMGDVLVVVYLLSVPTICIGLAGINARDEFTMLGATRALTQLFAYEVPFLLAILAPAFVARSWQIHEITAYAQYNWLIITQPIGFAVAVLGLMGKLERPPFDAPEAETEIVAGALTEYSGRGLALFHLARHVELVTGLTLVATFYLGGIRHPLDFALKTLSIMAVMAVIQTIVTRMRIDQTIGLWWHTMTLLALGQWLWVIGGQVL